MKINFFKLKNRKESKRMSLIKELTYDHGYSILRNSTTLKEANDFLLEMAKGYDEYGYMSDELGKELDKLFEDENYIIGIHRTGYTKIDEGTLNSIFNRGLINNGHIMSGGMSGNFDIERTVSLFWEFTAFVGQLKAAHGYKGSDGCIIVKIPKSYIGKVDGEVKPIYYMDGNIVKLLPEFIYGYVPVDKEGKLGHINRNSNYKDEHTLNNVNLKYDDSVYYKLTREGVKLESFDISLEEKYKIIEKSYKETLKKYNSRQAEYALLSLINENEVKYFTGSNNRELLRKYVIYGDIIKILSLTDLNLDSSNINTIINTFMENNNILVDKDKIK